MRDVAGAGRRGDQEITTKRDTHLGILTIRLGDEIVVDILSIYVIERGAEIA